MWATRADGACATSGFRAQGALLHKNPLLAWARRRALLAPSNPLSCGRPRTKRPAGARAWMRAIPPSAQDALSAEPGRGPRTRRAGCPAGATSGVPILWVTSPWASTAPQERRERRSRPRRGAGQDARSQEKVTRPQGCGRTTQGRESVSREKRYRRSSPYERNPIPRFNKNNANADSATTNPTINAYAVSNGTSLIPSKP